MFAEYMLVEADEFELPVLIGNINELSLFTGASVDVIRCAFSRHQPLRRKYFIFKVEKEEIHD